ncbi:MAG: hypothetical protein V3T70_03545, partial [Phycisphaerae bacterium]
MPSDTSKSRKLRAFWALMGLSCVTLLAPAAWTDGLKHLMQLLVPFQAPLHQAAGAATQRLREASRQAAGDPDADIGRTQAMQNQIVALTGQLRTMREENRQLRGLRERFVPPGVPLAPAHVVSRDIRGWRDSLLLSRGATSRVRPRDAVASRLFLNRGEADGVSVGHLVLAREVLLGRIEQVGPFTSRLRL